MGKTVPISCRIPTSLYQDICEVAQEEGMRVGSYLRKVVPFIRRHSHLMLMDSFMLEQFGVLARNRKILARLEGEKVTLEELADKGFEPRKYTGMIKPNAFGKMGGIQVLDYRLVRISKKTYQVKRIEYGNV